MPVTLVATPPGDATANSYATVAEAEAYFDTRLVVDGWENATTGGKEILLMMATRTIDAILSPRRIFVPPMGSRSGYYVNRPTWTGTRPATNLSHLAWPRAGMFDRNGVALSEVLIPQELKDATAELAGALGTKDTTLDNETVVQGITSIKAGPVALTFAEGAAMLSKVLPEAVLDLLVPSWLTEQQVESMFSAMFDLVSE